MRGKPKRARGNGALPAPSRPQQNQEQHVLGAVSSSQNAETSADGAGPSGLMVEGAEGEGELGDTVLHWKGTDGT